MGQLELDQTFTARTEINEILLRELDIATDPWGVKVTRVELRDIIPSKAVQDSMELQMAAERKNEPLFSLPKEKGIPPLTPLKVKQKLRC